MKDNFSTQASDYARFRPTYPPELIAALAGLAPGLQAAWDCGTGNGQVAVQLAEHFDAVFATDISAKQLSHAPAHPRIRYAVEPAEHCSAPVQAFDLATVAQAVHWFHFERFYAEVRRVLRPGGVLALVGYAMFRSGSDLLDEAILHFYTDTVGPFWDPERSYIEAGYRTLPFPFAEVPMPAFEMKASWSFDDLLGYLNSWSAVQHYRRSEGSNPVDQVAARLRQAWGGAAEREIRFPLLLRVGTAASIPDGRGNARF